MINENIPPTALPGMVYKFTYESEPEKLPLSYGPYTLKDDSAVSVETTQYTLYVYHTLASVVTSCEPEVCR